MIKQIIILRTDLNMRKGKMCAQAAHASMKVLVDQASNTGLMSGDLTIWLWPAAEEWLQGIFTKICVGCDSEQALLDLYKQALDAKLHCALIQDSGLTEFHGQPTYTALAIGPEQAELINPITGQLKLL